MRKFAGALAALFLLCAGAAHAETLRGPARIIDGDSLAIAGRPVRLLGIDAPELAQLCEDELGRSYACGKAAQRHLARLIAGRNLLCRGEVEDPYGRLLARCAVGSVDIARQMVLDGQAVVFVKFSDEFALEEELARKAGKGLWAGRFELPWEFRAHAWAASAEVAPDPGCPIKGNINRRGARIYHLPGDPDYARTRIDQAKGERWFCDEAEAVRAGWRPARH
ncbi:MAG TPA: thermonuclease family protein [Paracoccaceae bacterium]|nr:thermonuclease family protein [Paracoccaceae bacterium]